MARPALVPSHPARPDGLPEAFPTLTPSAPAERRFARVFSWRLRHVLMALLFLAMVPGPIGLSAWYLLTRTQPQYATTFGFIVHAEEDSGGGSLLAALPALGSLGSSSSKDTDVLARFLGSPTLVAELDAKLDLRKTWSANHDRDPVFALRPDSTAEDLAAYWDRMVRVHYDYSTGLMEVEVRSFDPDTSMAIARNIEAASSRLINRLSGVARQDRLGHATRELNLAEQRLISARRALTTFRARHQVIDPMANLTGDLAVVMDLQKQLAEEEVARDILRETLAQGTAGKRREDSGDFRIQQSDRRIDVLRDRIQAERSKISDAEGSGYAQLMGEFEELTVGVEIGQLAYATALSAREAARAEADRQSRYVATYAPASRPESAQYPKVWQWLSLIAVGSFLTWSILILILYGLRDRY